MKDKVMWCCNTIFGWLNPKWTAMTSFNDSRI